MQLVYPFLVFLLVVTVGIMFRAEVFILQAAVLATQWNFMVDAGPTYIPVLPPSYPLIVRNPYVSGECIYSCYGIDMPVS
jgi:hypothetical protein